MPSNYENIFTSRVGPYYPSEAHKFISGFKWVRVTRSLYLCVVFCRSLFLFVLFLFVILFTASDYPYVFPNCYYIMLAMNTYKDSIPMCLECFWASNYDNIFGLFITLNLWYNAYWKYDFYNPFIIHEKYFTRQERETSTTLCYIASILMILSWRLRNVFFSH
jgi:hypothetical protein